MGTPVGGARSSNPSTAVSKRSPTTRTRHCSRTGPWEHLGGQLGFRPPRVRLVGEQSRKSEGGSRNTSPKSKPHKLRNWTRKKSASSATRPEPAKFGPAGSGPCHSASRHQMVPAAPIFLGFQPPWGRFPPNLGRHFELFVFTPARRECRLGAGLTGRAVYTVLRRADGCCLAGNVHQATYSARLAAHLVLSKAKSCTASPFQVPKA